MTSGYPCPNPTCTHVFPYAAVTGKASLSCPRCGHVFQFHAPARPAKAAQLAPARPAPVAPAAAPEQVPTAIPIHESVPVASELAPAHDGLVAVPSRLARRPKRSWGKTIVTALFVLLAIGGAGGSVWWLVKKGVPLLPNIDLVEGGGGSGGHTSKEFNYRLTYPPAPWERDDRTGIDFRANLAFRRTNPTAWFALIARDYKTRTPRDSEIQEQGVRLLEDFFEDVGRDSAPQTTLAGQPAQRFVFQGISKKTNANMAGECTQLAHQGVAYWLITWAPAEQIQTAQKEFEALRQRFSLLNERHDWQEKRPRPVEYPGVKAEYVLRDTEGLWKPQTASDFDEKADQAFLAHERAEVGSVPDKAGDGDQAMPLARKTATVEVLVLDPDPSLQGAMQVAIKHLEARKKKIAPETTIGKPLSEHDERLGGLPARVALLRVKAPPEPERFVLLAVISRPQHVMAFLCECDWKAREKGKWEADFRQFLRSFRIK